jgi:hypothetical protein
MEKERLSPTWLGVSQKVLQFDWVVGRVDGEISRGDTSLGEMSWDEKWLPGSADGTLGVVGTLVLMSVRGATSCRAGNMRQG